MSLKTPNFFIVGAVKSGTTSLYDYLDQHPQVFMSPVKEPHFFSSADMDFSSFRPLIKKRVAQFNLIQYLDSPMKEKVHRAYVTKWDDYLRLFTNAGNAKAIGEASTSYLWSPSAAKIIRKKIPDARIIILLRNPVQRAFSHYLMDLKINFTRLPFSAAIAADQATVNPSWGKNSMYVQSGFYIPQVKRYLDVLPQEAVRVVLFEDLIADAAATVKGIFEFLEVDPGFIPDLSKRLNASALPANALFSGLYNNLLVRKFVSGKTGDKLKRPLKKLFFKTNGLPELSMEERERLILLYKEDILGLQSLIKRDLSIWLK